MLLLVRGCWAMGKAARRQKNLRREVGLLSDRCDLCLGLFSFSEVVFFGDGEEDFTFCSECFELVMPGIAESMTAHCSICSAGGSHA